MLTSASSTGKSKSDGKARALGNVTVTGKGKKAKKTPKAQKEKSKSESKAAVDALATIAPRQKFNAVFATTHSRLVVGSPFVTGHCYFEAVLVSSELLKGMGDKCGAKLVRTILAGAYRCPRIQHGLALWVLNDQRRMRPGYLSAVAAAEDAAASSAGLNAETHWHASFFNARASLMETVNCLVPSTDLWVYNLDTDVYALTIALLRPLVVIGIDHTGEDGEEERFLFNAFVPDLDYRAACQDKRGIFEGTAGGVIFICRKKNRAAPPVFLSTASVVLGRTVNTRCATRLRPSQGFECGFINSDREQGREHQAAESRLGGMQSCLNRVGARVRVLRV